MVVIIQKRNYLEEGVLVNGEDADEVELVPPNHDNIR